MWGQGFSIDHAQAGATLLSCNKKQCVFSLARGFSLVELLVTLAILAVIASVAVPAYQNYILRSHFADATSNLALLATQLESTYLEKRSYSKDGSNCNVSFPVDERFIFSCQLTQQGQGYKLQAANSAKLNVGGTIKFELNENGQPRTIVNSTHIPSGEYDCWITNSEAKCR